MKCLRCFLCALSLALLGLPPSRPAAGQDPSFGERIEVNVVNVEVYVTDKSGNPVTGLQRGDFEILEDGKRMEVLNFQAYEHQIAETAQPAPQPGASAPSQPAAAIPDPIHWVVYVDNFNIRPAHRNRALRQIRDFLTQHLAPGDQVLLVTYDLGLNIRLPFTADRTALAEALSKIEGLTANGAELERARRTAMERILSIQDMAIRGRGQAESEPCPMEIVEPARSFADQARQEVLRTINGLTLLVNSLSGLPGRKALLHVSDGISVTPGEELFEALYVLCGSGSATAGPMDKNLGVRDMTGGNSTAYQANQAAIDAQAYSTANNWSALAAHANAQRVTLYTLQASGLEGTSSAAADIGPGGEKLLSMPQVASIESSNRQQSLSVLANETGGRAIFNANDLRPDLARIQEDVQTYYSLGYSPPHLGDGRDHRIEVKVKRPGLLVRYRKGYRDKPSLERAVDRTLAALFYGVEDNPLDVSLEIGDVTAGAGGSYTVPVQLRIPLFKLVLQDRDNKIEGKIRLLVATRDAKGAMSPVRQVEVPISIPREKVLTALGQYYLYEVRLNLPAGEQRVAVAVRDEATTLTSFLEEKVQVGAAGAGVKALTP
ncbi:MAG TPA: VWA domain-containing protein [Thermoanaerobaculia bacterium]